MVVEHRLIRVLPLLAAATLVASCTRVSSTTYTQPTTEEAVAPVVTVEKTVKNSHELLAAEIAKIIADERFADARWGVLVESLDSGDIWYEQSADELFIPASNQKIPTCAAAFLALGPDFRFKTTIAHTGTITNGKLEGDLVVFGQGDPTHYTRWRDDSRDDFRDWARILKGQGINTITGNIIGDDNAWDDTHVGEGWPADGLTPWYYAQYSALNFNENYIDLTFQPPAELTGTVTITPNVPSSYFTLNPQIQVVESGGNNVRMYRAPDNNIINLTGQVQVGGRSFEQTPTINNPTGFYVTVLKEVLEEEGIRVIGNAVDCDDLEGWNKKPSDLSTLHEHHSAPLSEILAMLFKRSQNMYSEVMVYTMGWNATGLGTFANGRAVVQEQLKKIGVEPEEYVYSDGSGLSRINRLSPRVVNRLNRAMYGSDLSEQWWNIQSIAGVDGTLRSRMRGTPAENNVRGKTGTLNGVRALSGFVTTASGEKILFSMLVNGHTQSASTVDSVTDAVTVLLAEFEG